MAVTAGTGGTGTVDTTATSIFDVTATPRSGVTSLQIWNEDSSNALNVICTGLHDSGAELSLPPGKTTVLRLGTKELLKVQVSAATSTIEIHWGVVASTGAEQ